MHSSLKSHLRGPKDLSFFCPIIDAEVKFCRPSYHQRRAIQIITVSEFPGDGDGDSRGISFLHRLLAMSATVDGEKVADSYATFMDLADDILNSWAMRAAHELGVLDASTDLAALEARKDLAALEASKKKEGTPE